MLQRIPFLHAFQQQRPQPEINLDEILAGVKSFFNRIGGRLGGGGIGLVILLIIGAIAVIWLATGLYRVPAGSQGVVRLFGDFNTLEGPGLHWRFPSPITSLVKVNTEEIRTDRIGFRINPDVPGSSVRALDEALMLTTDNSIVEAQMVVQYRIGNPRDFVFNVANPEQVLHTAAEVALRSIVGRTDLQSVITVGRATVEQDTRVFLERLLEDYRTGISLTDLKLQTVDPPDQVKDAFQEVTRALEDETRLQNEAEAYKADQIPRAQGQVQVTVRAAAAFHTQQVERATGEGNRFLSLLAEYREAPQVTRERLYLETLEDVLSTVNKTLIDPQVNILPLLELSELLNQGP
ncbi:MAG: FtsH protease activity modulator HflK [Chloroflexi bacterium]|nr:FtsH protease activity modulator HflK [Chloroflexota bacterium]